MCFLNSDCKKSLPYPSQLNMICSDVFHKVIYTQLFITIMVLANTISCLVQCNHSLFKVTWKQPAMNHITMQGHSLLKYTMILFRSIYYNFLIFQMRSFPTQSVFQCGFDNCRKLLNNTMNNKRWISIRQ